MSKRSFLQQACELVPEYKIEEIAKRTRTEMLKAAWGEKSLLHCKHCAGALVVIKLYPRKRAPPLMVV